MDYTYLRKDLHPNPEVSEHSIYECGICGAMHPWRWDGDCRDDANRYFDAGDYAGRNGVSEMEVQEYDMSQREAADQGDPNWLHADEDGYIQNEDSMWVPDTEISV